MKILITGACGQLGNELARCLTTGCSEIGRIPAEYEGAEVDYVDYDRLDISDAGAVDTWFREHGPYDVVFNGAAVTNVDGCESNEEGAFAVNALGPENLARACARDNAVLVQVSTDYVFPGTEPGERDESDAVAPISAYGRTKLAGEERAMAANPRTHVARTAWLYGYVGRNFVKTMLGLAERLPQVTVVDDQLGNPTSANDLAHELLKIALSDDYGVWHTTCEGTCSWADFAAAVMDGAGVGCAVVPVTSVQYKEANPASADRPAFSSLKNGHLERTLGNEMRQWRDALDCYLAKLPELDNVPVIPGQTSKEA